MRFGPWIALGNAVAPPGPGVLQIRFGEGATGVFPYPSGKSAMCFYDADDTSLKAALARARTHAKIATRDDLFVRFAELSDPPTPKARVAKLISEFAARFGRPPLFND